LNVKLVLALKLQAPPAAIVPALVSTTRDVIDAPPIPPIPPPTATHVPWQESGNALLAVGADRVTLNWPFGESDALFSRASTDTK
jgi:hypothetical protein